MYVQAAGALQNDGFNANPTMNGLIFFLQFFLFLFLSFSVFSIFFFIEGRLIFIRIFALRSLEYYALLRKTIIHSIPLNRV